jgi:hypothetical protein
MAATTREAALPLALHFLPGDRHEVSQMTKFHFTPVYPIGMVSQATRYFHRISFAGMVRK